MNNYNKSTWTFKNNSWIIIIKVYEFEFGDNRKHIDNLGIDFDLLFETLLKNEFTVNLPIVQDFLINTYWSTDIISGINRINLLPLE